MAGCFRDAVYSARRTIGDYLRAGYANCLRDARVRRISEDGQFLEVATGGQLHRHGPFDKVFLCAGCPGTTEIVLRSAGIGDGIVMRDNAVYVFPIVYWGRRSTENRTDQHLALCNLILGCLPPDDQHFAQVQVYPNFDYLWRFNLPEWLWKVVRPLMCAFRPRLMWGRLYVHSDLSQSYALRMKDDRLRFEIASEPTWDDYHETLFSSVRRAIGRDRFWVPPIRPVRQKANSHYAATLPFHNPVLSVSSTGEVLPGVHLCDSSCFPDAPAVSPTFSIMANAYRVASSVFEPGRKPTELQRIAT